MKETGENNGVGGSCISPPVSGSPSSDLEIELSTGGHIRRMIGVQLCKVAAIYFMKPRPRV